MPAIQWCCLSNKRRLKYPVDKIGSEFGLMVDGLWRIYMERLDMDFSF